MVKKKKKKTALELGIENRMGKMIMKRSFITWNDHKNNFPNKTIILRLFWLLNPTKNNVGKINKKKKIQEKSKPICMPNIGCQSMATHKGSYRIV